MQKLHSEPRKRTSVTFSFMSKDESGIWSEEYEAFQKRFDERRKALKKSVESSLDYIGYGGLTPTR